MLKPEPFRLAGRYELRTLAGHGGMGQVWAGYDHVLRRDVAIKHISPLPGASEHDLQLLCGMAMREAQTAAQISHANTVRIYDLVEQDGMPWIVMEYVPSETLHAIVRRNGPVSAGYAATIGLAVLDALNATHDAGVLHRDVTPTMS